MSAAERFPELVWSAAMLRGLDARAQREIEAAGAVRVVKTNDVVFRAGEPADAFFVVVEGAVELRVGDGEAGARAIRLARRGDAFGEEATESFATRSMRAVCVEKGRVVEIAVGVFRRAAGRSGDEGLAIASRIERTLRRAAARDLLRALLGSRDEATLDRLIDAGERRVLASNEPLYRVGDRAHQAFVVGGGLVSIQRAVDDRINVHAIHLRGEVLGLSSGARTDDAIALDPGWVLALPRELAARALAPPSTKTLEIAAPRDHAFADLFRMTTARSMLVIDREACVRCGQCTQSCAATHDDGIARMARVGEAIVARVRQDDGAARTMQLLVTRSCHHCEAPACLVDCPTGAITRDASGSVAIRASACIGCGHCAKACPWGNVEMAPRPPPSPTGPQVIEARRHLPILGATKTSNDRAVKCDLCVELADGPACVRACPVDAIARVVPSEVMIDVDALVSARASGAFPRRRAGWPWISAAALVAIGVAVGLRDASRLSSGLGVGALLAILLSYPLVRRLGLGRKRIGGAPPTARRSHARLHYVGHVALGLVAAAMVVAHTRLHAPANVAGALSIAFVAASLVGLLAAVVHRLVPARLARLEREGMLPEDRAARIAELEAQTFAVLTGRSEVVKTIYTRILGRYARGPLGVIGLALRAPRAEDEERRLAREIERATSGRKSERLTGVDALVRVVVESRAVIAARWLERLLRAMVPIHAALAALVAALLVLHVAFVALSALGALGALGAWVGSTR